MKIMNSKLDTIISMMQVQQEGSCGLSFKAVNISGGGMSFSLAETIPLGETLEIKIMLTFQYPVILTLYGEVVKSELREDGHFVAVHYAYMDDAIRDEIIRFVFEREREILRERRR
jgi:c-di-GMP-binding flagellar brake protein YcgR